APSAAAGLETRAPDAAASEVASPAQAAATSAAPAEASAGAESRDRAEQQQTDRQPDAAAPAAYDDADAAGLGYGGGKKFGGYGGKKFIGGTNVKNIKIENEDWGGDGGFGGGWD
ncbi:hypothetical protein HK405_015735, partial [Cladochytrium tenue]